MTATIIIKKKMQVSVMSSIWLVFSEFALFIKVAFGYHYLL